MMQMKQQQELQRYLEQVHQNIETVSASELLQAIMAQQSYLGQQSVVSGIGTGTAWSSVVQLASPSAGMIYSTAGVHQSTLPATFVPQTLGDVTMAETTVNHQGVLPSSTMPPVTVVDSLHGEPCADVTTVGPPVVDGSTAADGWPMTTVSSVNADIAAIPDPLDLVSEVADLADGSCSPSVSLRRTNSLKEQARPAMSSDCEVSNSDQSVHLALRRKQSAEAAALLLGTGLTAAPLTSDSVDSVPHSLPEISSLGFVPIQDHPISSRSDSMDSMASSLAGSSMQQSVENSDLVHQPQPVSVSEMPATETGTKSSCQPIAGNASVQPVTTVVSSHRPNELLDTLQSLLGQFAAGNSDPAAMTPGHSLSSTSNEPAQQLQQSQAIIQQQQQQQLAAIASAIQNLQHLRSLQEAIGCLAVALKTSQLQMLSAELQAAEVNPPAAASVPGNVTSVAATTIPVPGRSPTVPASSVHASATPAVPPPAAVSSTVPGLVPEPRSLPPSQMAAAAQLSALGLAQHPTTSNALLMPSNAVQQQQQQLLLAMMQSAPYQQQQQQLLMQQLLSQNAVMMQQGAVSGARIQPQQPQPWPAMMMMPPHCAASTVRRPTPHPSVPPMMSAQPLPVRLAVPAARQPFVNPGSLPGTGTLPPPADTGVRSGAQTPAMTSCSVTASVPSIQTSLPDQR